MTKLTSISINYFQGRRRQQKSSIAIDDKWIFLVLIASEVYSVVTYLLTYLLTYLRTFGNSDDSNSDCYARAEVTKMLLAGLRSVRIGKNCDLGLENAALGLRLTSVTVFTYTLPASQ